MASLHRLLQQSAPQNTSSRGTPAPVDNALALAKEQQRDLAARAQSAPGNDPLQSFDSSMSREDVRARFTQLVQRSREAVFA